MIEVSTLAPYQKGIESRDEADGANDKQIRSYNGVKKVDAIGSSLSPAFAPNALGIFQREEKIPHLALAFLSVLRVHAAAHTKFSPSLRIVSNGEAQRACGEENPPARNWVMVGKYIAEPNRKQIPPIWLHA